MIEQRFWATVYKDGPVPTARPDLGPCWIWTACKQSKGYGQFRVDGRTVLAHRFAYELLVGPIPEGYELDHLCRVHLCVNSLLHMEPVTHQVNVLRGLSPESTKVRAREKTCCPSGHPYDEANTRWYRGGRHCRTCRRAHKRARRAQLQGGQP